MTEPLLALRNVTRHFHTQAGVVRALDDVSLHVSRGETLGLVGESGCGKSTVARVAMRLTDVDTGRVLLDGEDIGARRGSALDTIRTRLQMVFQDPAASLNPRTTVGRALEEPLIVHRRGASAARRARVAEMLDKVGLHADMAARLPHELSGGQRQRVAIARALMLEPDLIVCDEAVSALDVSIRAQVLNLLLDLRDTLGIAYLFISHDLAVVRHMSDRIAVMYLGQVVEQGPRDAVWDSALHPYTRALIASAPSARREARERPGAVIEGELPSPLAPPAGCRFHTRCAYASAQCRESAPVLRERDAGHWVACHVA
ncbi:peptide/nickel transport system ATP-binding protein [Cupriavidus sp. OV038]|jgi:peptide/nickel transport system ATP-binding protein|uniref:ABC transporter ATP-binding protein n=1 Tax=unclassified Cupriavidus TaxID=2640874 RepID=UPI0008F3A26D|nr:MULTISPECIES: ABC transporter ATP-binding protein [unclassified Cupriavidus]SFD22921.1 peptide/nickel transport system ATP-binding protein [Cupriavidus sp. OV038]SFP92167.1 peptide/nickel transport system ATP-binding protein [Cupriavidus sp. OV096]